jgi:hypothetical protein
VSATAESRIHIETTRHRGERLEHFLDKHRLVPICVLHAYTPYLFAPYARRTDRGLRARPSSSATAATLTTTENPAPSTDRSRSPRS